MLNIFLKILSVAGIVLLVILAVLLVLLLLVLFFPITYRADGRREGKNFQISLGLTWLPAFLRVRFQYPEPGLLTVKLFCFRLLELKLPPEKDDSKKETEKNPADKKQKAETRKTGHNQTTGQQASENQETDTADPREETDLQADNSQQITDQQAAEIRQDTDTRPAEAQERTDPQADKSQQETDAQTGETRETGTDSGTADDSRNADNQAAGDGGVFSKKFEKIKYTIHSICDKIKKVWENINYYLSVLTEKETRILIAGIKKRVFRILKAIRPRRGNADILFGTKSPDITGYIYGLYCMLMAGRPEIRVVPDFERTVFEGHYSFSGHIVVFVLLVNVLKILLNRQLHSLIKKLKKKETEIKEETKNGR